MHSYKHRYTQPISYIAILCAQTTVDGERFARLNIRDFSAIEVFAEILLRCLGHKQCISTHFSKIKERHLYSRKNFRGTYS